MRKDVKVALGVGGIVLAVLIIYVLKTPSENKEADNQPAKVAQIEPEIALAPSTQPGQVAIGPASTPPSVSAADPFAARPTTNPSETTVTPTASGGKTDWSYLQTGKLQSLSAAAPSRTSDPVALVAMQGGNNSSSLSEPTTRSSSGSRTHTVHKGETLSSIAQVAYGNASHFSTIAKANPKINPSKLRPGTVIILPEVAASRPPQAGQGAVSPSSTGSSSSNYKVQPGDSLEKIATKLYGSSSKWEKIYDLNKSKIGSDPHKIKAEMVLVLPDEPTAH